MARKVGGRLLPCEPGSTQYEEDEFRGLRRRPWMFFRVGVVTNEITTEHVIHFVTKLRETLIENGVLLDGETEHLKYTLVGTDYALWYKELKDGLDQSKYKYEEGPLSCPIVITILDQHDRSEVDKVISHFSHEMHFCKLEKDEVLEMLQQDDYRDMDKLCIDFAEYLIEQEGLLESLAIKAPVEEIEFAFGTTFPVSRTGFGGFGQQRRHETRQKTGKQPMDWKGSYNKAPPGLAPPGLHSQKHTVSTAPPPGLGSYHPPRHEHEHRPRPATSPREHHPQQQVTENRSFAPPPGIPIARPPGIDGPAPTATVSHSSTRDVSDSIEFFDDGSEELKEEEIIDPHVLSYDLVRSARRHVVDNEDPRGSPLHTSNPMARAINCSTTYARFATPFVSLIHNLDFLYVINFSVATRDKDYHDDVKQLFREAFNAGFPDKLRKRFLNPRFYSNEWREDDAEMLFELIMFYFYTARFRRRLIVGIETFIPSWNEMIKSFSRVDDQKLRNVGVLPAELVNLRKVTKKVEYWIQSALSHDSDQTQMTQDQRFEMSSRNDRTLFGETDHTFREQSGSHHRGESRIHQDSRERFQPEENKRLQELRREDNPYAQRLNRMQEERRVDESRETYNTQRRFGEHNDEGLDEVDQAMRSRSRQDRQDRYEEQPDVPLGFRQDTGPVYEKHEVCESIGENVQESEEVMEEQEEQPVVNTDERPKQEYKFVQNEYQYEPLWKKFELIDPPEDFRTLTAVPILQDYMNTENEPYLRRIQESGVYKSAAHYLDVQFRLLREDLVSSLRDGLDLYRKTGTCKGHRIPGVDCSDVSICNIERVDGKQVTERDGLEMRIVWPAPFDLTRLMDNEREAKESGLAILSCDRFVEDYHLVIISSSLLNTKGCLHLVILESSRPFKANTGYQMAQGKSYLPSYEFVLKNMKKVNPFKPIPFERYLVHGKKTIFRPPFHRHEKTEEQLAEERRLEKLYGEIRSIAVSKRIMKGKAIPGGIDDDDDEDFRYNRGHKDDAPNDEEYEMLQEPMFRQHLGVSNGGSDKIMIDHKWYSISKMLDEFHPDYLDDSQRVAFCQTFKNEISLIQGPPGTGKTHIGVKILKTMLHNRSHWRMTEPILIVCYTNSGLDNLLERVWQMIDDDETLSRDQGKPRMIRYGRKCESEFLRRRNVMRMDVNDQYKQKVPENILRDQSKASTQKRRKGEILGVSSYTLYCSRNELVSFSVICNIMDVNHQNEMKIFAEGHVDSKERPLSLDEAFACWLLDRDFGSANKAQTKKINKSKFKNLPEDSDDERPTHLTVENSDDEDESDLNDEQILDKLFKKMNLECSGKDVLGSTKGDEADEYFTKSPWELVNNHQSRLVVLLGKKDKDGASIDENIAELVKEVKEMILSTQPLKKEELADIKFIFSLARPKRWALYQTWCDGLRKLMAENLPREIREYRAACQTAQKSFEVIDSEIMKMAMVIGATTSGCSRLRSALEQAKPRILLVEEAAEVLEGHIVSAMISSVEQVVMIGDHKQLRPMPAVHALGTEYGLNISMFERLVERGLPYTQLRSQHRMNVTIADNIVRPAFYDNVQDSPNVFDYPDTDGMATNLYFWSHAEKEETPDGISWLNKHEVDMTVALVRYLLKQSYTYKDIVVLATYAAQRNYMVYEFPALLGPSEHQLVPVETVDSFQGREKKIVIVSLVRSHRGVKEYSGIGFLAVANRICVALTRAQHGMYIIGNGEYLMEQSDLWKKIGRKMDKGDSLIGYCLPLKCSAHGNITEIRHPRDFATSAPEGGCSEVCNIQKLCGHLCERKCHPHVEEEHLKPCEYKCTLTCPNPNYNHQCTKRCYEDCGSCMSFVEVELECGHQISTPCSRVQSAQCDQKCNKKLSCGHPCTNDCGEMCTEICKNAVHTELECGHVKEVMCGLLRLGHYDPTCVEKCREKMMLCDHYCTERCGEQCTVVCKELVTVTLDCTHQQTVICSDLGVDHSTAHIECKTLVPMLLQPCNHRDKVPCGSEPFTDICTQPCPQVLPECNHQCGDACGTCYKTGKHVCQTICNKPFECGHSCTAKCGEKCPSCRAYCSNACTHQSCGLGERCFGRECFMLCALCTKTCFNRCLHRSCTKRCYQECNVKVCNEPCAEKLKCGHACLGMCGEKCPKICGTCERDKYIQCVASMKGNTQKVHRLVMNPKCHHIYPVEFLDEHVKKEKEENKQLTCPRCSAYIVGVVRYAKYEKKRVLDENTKKMKEISKDVNSREYSDILIDKIASERCSLRNIRMNHTNEVQASIFRLDEACNDLREELLVIRGKNEHKWKLRFYLEVVRCFQAVIRLLMSGSIYRLVKRKDFPPNMEQMQIRVFGDFAFPRMMAEFAVLAEHMFAHWPSDMPGAFMPLTRFLLAKMTVLNEVTAMCFQLKCEGRDITELQSRAIGNACLKLFTQNETQNVDQNIAPIEEVLYNTVPRLSELGSLFTWKKLNVPTF